MDDKRELLLKAAARLYSLGIEVEAARQKLKNLVSTGASYELHEIMETLQNYQTLDAQWKQLESDYLKLRDEILS